jgi:hypothetical protein
MTVARREIDGDKNLAKWYAKLVNDNNLSYDFVAKELSRGER